MSGTTSAGASKHSYPDANAETAQTSPRAGQTAQPPPACAHIVQSTLVEDAALLTLEDPQQQQTVSPPGRSAAQPEEELPPALSHRWAQECHVGPASLQSDPHGRH